MYRRITVVVAALFLTFSLASIVAQPASATVYVSPSACASLTLNSKTHTAICITKTRSSMMTAAQKKMVANSSTPSPILSALDLVNCKAEGCWFRSGAFDIIFASNKIAYGTYSNLDGKMKIIELGVVNYLVGWEISGSHGQTMGIYDEIRSTHATSRTIFTGDLANGDVGVYYGGNLIHNCKEQDTGKAFAGEYILPHTDPFCRETDTSNRNHNMAAEMTWFDTSKANNDAGIDWDCYTRSVVAHKQPNGIYEFEGAHKLPGNPVACASHGGYQIPVIPE